MTVSRRNSRLRALARVCTLFPTVAAVSIVLAACSSSDNGSGITDPGSNFTTIQLNSTTSTAYLSLGSTASVVTVGDATTSTAWDLAFTPSPDVTVNGGASGPGSVKAYCLCANSKLTLAQVEALSATSGTEAFGAVTTTSVPTDSLFQADAASYAITGWYNYDATTHGVSAASNVWGIRLATTNGGYAKFHVTSIPSPTQSTAGPVTIQWAVQATSSGALGADKSATIDLSSGTKVYVNLTAGTTSNSSSTPWDIAMQGYTIFVNVAANVGAVSLVPSTFYASYAAITQIPVGASGIPSTAFGTDGAGGAFLAAQPYRYDPTSHQVYPTYDVYLVKKGSTVYKVQIASYYNTGGTFGYVTVRYAKLSG
ncbi:MAG TPA: HmuY family protein [Gemmatimonadaceae bacterium]